MSIYPRIERLRINYGETIKEVIINEGATEIGEGAFDGYYYRKSSTPGYNGDTAKYWSFRKVSLPSTVTKIDRSAFSNCHSLEEINIPEGVTKIGSVTFWRCYSLKQINIPDSVIEIEENAFGESGIEKMMLPDSVVKMDGAFSDCYDLEQINIPDGITEIGDETFFRCHNLREIHIPDRVTRIGDLAMYGTGLKEIHIPDSVTEIGVAAFGACYGLKKIVIPGSVKKIGHSAFSYGELEEIIFLGDVPEILEKMKNDYGLYGDYVGEVFQDNTGIAYYPASNPTWTEEARMAIGSKLDWIAYGELKILPEVTDNVYVLGGSNGATIACSGEFKDFVDVYMDDVLVDKENYTVAEGSTILTFASKYLNTLSVGTHKVTLNYTYGSIDTQLEILAYGSGSGSGEAGVTDPGSGAEGSAGADVPATRTAAVSGARITKKSPQTGDENRALPWLLLCFAAVCGGTAVSVRKKKMRE